jgi:hypothetical protein
MITSDGEGNQVTNSQTGAGGTDNLQRAANMKDINDMEKQAARLRRLNACIRVAATAGTVEEMMTLIEQRKAFLDSLSLVMERRSAPLITALQEAVLDNANVITGLENVMDMAHKRGKINFAARRRYHKTQTTS